MGARLTRFPTPCLLLLQGGDNYTLWPLWVWLYCIFFWFIQDACKVLAYYLILKFDVFQVSRPGLRVGVRGVEVVRWWCAEGGGRDGRLGGANKQVLPGARARCPPPCRAHPFLASPVLTLHARTLAALLCRPAPVAWSTCVTPSPPTTARSLRRLPAW